METVDLLIVGAGFAGLAAARAAALRGLSTRVLERKRDPGQHPHTTGILVKEVAEEWDLPAELTRAIPAVRLYSPSLKTLDLARPGYYFLATDTPNLLRWLAREATRAGARISCATPFTGGRIEGDFVVLDELDLRARFLLGADGALSSVARAFNLGQNRRLLNGFELEFAGVSGMDERFLHCFLDSELSPGYIGWAVPGLGVTQVGLASRLPGKPDIARFEAKLRERLGLATARIVGRRAGVIPIGGPIGDFHRGPVLLVGDAAGLVSPLTAGGIRTALHFGRRAGVVCADHLLHAGPHPALALENGLPRFFWKGLLRRAFDATPSNRLLDFALDSASFRALARLIFFHNRGLYSPAAWAELATRRAPNPSRLAPETAQAR